MDIDFNKLRQFDCTLDGEAFAVYQIKVNDRMFSGFEANVTVVSTRKLKIHDYLNKKAVLTLIGKGGGNHFAGTITAVRDGAPTARYYLYDVGITSCLWPLTQISDVRIFQDLTPPDIIAEVLKTSKLLTSEYEFRFKLTYSPRNYCVQYRETNMDFISRVMAEEGMFFYFEYKKDRHHLVFGDSALCHLNIPGDPVVLYSEKGQLVSRDEFVTRLVSLDQITTGKVHLTDYDFTHPSRLPVSDKSSDEFDWLECYDHPGRLMDQKTGLRLAETQLESSTWKRHLLTGESICRRLTAGHLFTLLGQSGRDSKVEYLITSVIHTGTQPQSLQELAGSEEGNTYGNTITCVPSNVSFRPDHPRNKPSVMGVQTAIVTGPKDEEIYTDQYGRIKVQFHWDRLGKKDDRSSCWMRVAQPWAGAGWGSMFIPRIGQEVIVNFIDGDPDRPVVTGAVYNGANMPPYSLPSEKTKSTIKTESTKGGGGFNELRFEDKKSEEEIYIHGQKDWTIEILNDKAQTIGHDEKLDVKNDRTKTVGHDQKEDIGNDKTITVAKNHTETIGENMSVTIGKNLDEKTGDNKTEAVGKNFTNTVGEDADIRVGGNETIDIGKNNSKKIGENSTVSVSKDLRISVDNDASVSVRHHGSVNTEETMTATAGKTVSITSSGADVVVKTGGASVIITSSGDITLKGANITLDASGTITMNGKAINQN